MARWSLWGCPLGVFEVNEIKQVGMEFNLTPREKEHLKSNNCLYCQVSLIIPNPVYDLEITSGKTWWTISVTDRKLLQMRTDIPI